ncbi:HAD hydrolase-like protein [Halolamina sp. R1-12]|nr:HAD hydrolase-like protein [Halolamina sp. R1-12]
MVPGWAKEALEYVREQYAVGLITAGTEKTQLPKLATLGIADCFEVVVCCGHGTGIESKPPSGTFRNGDRRTRDRP